MLSASKIVSLIENSEWNGYDNHSCDSEETSCEQANYSFQESITECHEYIANMEGRISEAVESGNDYRVEALTEAAGDGIIERVKEAFKKLGNFIKSLLVKFASFVTSHLGATKQWLKVNEKRLKEYHGDVEVEIRPWSMSKIDTVVEFIKVERVSDLIDDFKFDSSSPSGVSLSVKQGAKLLNIDTSKAESRDKIKETMLMIFFNTDKVKELDDLDDFIDTQLGEKDTLDVGVHKEDFVEVIKKSSQSLDKIKNIGNKLINSIEKARNTWNKVNINNLGNVKNVNDEDLKKRMRENANNRIRNITAGLSIVGSAFSKYLTMVKKYISKGTKECMYALNKWMGKKDED